MKAIPKASIFSLSLLLCAFSAGAFATSAQDSSKFISSLKYSIYNNSDKNFSGLPAGDQESVKVHFYDGKPYTDVKFLSVAGFPTCLSIAAHNYLLNGLYVDARAHIYPDTLCSGFSVKVAKLSGDTPSYKVDIIEKA